MPHTSDRYYADAGHNGGFVVVPAADLQVDSALLVPTRNAAGSWSLNRTSGGVETYHIAASLPSLRRLLVSYQAESAFQEQFNMAPPVQGRPPFTGISELTVPTTVGPKKGIQIDSVSVKYTVGVVGLTSASLRLDENIGANNVADNIVSMPIAATALPLLVQANPYVVERVVTTPGYIVDDFSSVFAELTVVLANTGTIAIQWIGFDVHFNYD